MKFLQIENKAAKVSLNEQVDKYSMDQIREEIDRTYGASAATNGADFGEIMNFAENAIDTLDIDIHSPGGSVLDGYTLYNDLKELRARGVFVTAHVTLAASMASVIAMAADKVVMKEGARMMIHEASAGTQGDAAEHAKRAELLESISDEIAAIYSDRTGNDKKTVRDWMKAETWMDGKTATERKFADEFFDTQTKAEAMSILARLTTPSASEAQERIVALESQIVDLASAEVEFSNKLALLENALEEATTELLANKASHEAAVAALTESKDAEIAAAAEITEAKVSARASELLAATGHPDPVALEAGPQGDGQTVKTRSEFNSLSPSDRLAFVQSGGKIK